MNNMNKYMILRYVCDILFFGAIIMNMGALMISNMIVVKENPNAKVIEGNPISAQAQGFEVHPETSKVKDFFLKAYLPLFLSAFSLAALVTYYVYIRFIKYTKVWLILLYSSLCFFLLAYDFINNIGILIGLRIYGC
jgi:hypothetical protein